MYNRNKYAGNINNNNNNINYIRENYNKNNNNNNNNNNNHEIDNININIFKDDNLKEMEFDNILDDNEFYNHHININNVKNSNNNNNYNNFNSNKIENNSGSGADWEYLKKTVHSKDGKYLSDDFIKYHQIMDQIVEDEDNIVNMHMNIIKEDARLLTEEGDLITKIKRKNDEESIDESTYHTELNKYSEKLDNIINKKLELYKDLQSKLDLYKAHIKEEDELRAVINPKYFIES